jgi:2-polyprenyl-3-methyl-5-hydroxy-6-metoxy-1,4-benzoquinol methylase/uncharacterized protein YbaR (Trm112 family)
MRRWLLDLLVCPNCPGEPSLGLGDAACDGEDIVSGRLTCPHCGVHFPVVGGVPRFVATDDDYCGNFGFQWRHWRAIQVDRLSGHHLSEGRFLADTGWDPASLAGKLVLDCGCGAGRFSDVAAGFGARVVACDLSAAVEACRDNTAERNGLVQPIQASLFALPLRRAAFDDLFCMGVIQHTPQPAMLMRALPAFLAPGGRLTYNFYEADFWPWLQGIKYALRLVTPHLPTAATLALSKALVAVLFPLTRALAGIRKVRILNHMMPICASHSPQLTREQQRVWTLLDTFDWYSPRYEKRQRHGDVATLLRSLGLAEVASRPGLAWAQVPENAAPGKGAGG